MVVDTNLPGVYRYGMDESVDFPAIGLQYKLNTNKFWNFQTNHKGYLQNLTCDYLFRHYDDVIMTTIASQITSLMVVYSVVYSAANQRKIKAPRH